MNERLAALVAKPEVDATIAGLKAEGVYDDGRQIKEFDDETVAIPIDTPPTSTPVDRIITQDDPSYRRQTIRDMLAARGWEKSALETVPASWSVLGSVIVADFDGCVNPEAVGEVLLELHRNADTVVEIESIDGDRRLPSTRVIAGYGDTETVHTEHGTKYAMDLARVMFSPGNKQERVHMGSVTDPSETVFDMFAGIGYFTLPIARAGARVTATEINPEAFKFLVENARLNGVADRIDCYCDTCRALDITADRVVMGHYDAASYLDAAIPATRQGGLLHLHTTGSTDTIWETAATSLSEETYRHGRDVTIEDRRRIKTIGPGLIHGVVDCRIE